MLCLSGEGERVSFGKNTVKARNTVESWLGMVESAMVSSLRRLAKQGMASYVEEPRADWVLQQPAQLVIAVSQVCWCGSVEEALKSPAPVQKLAELHEVRRLLCRSLRLHQTPETSVDYDHHPSQDTILSSLATLCPPPFCKPEAN